MMLASTLSLMMMSCQNDDGGGLFSGSKSSIEEFLTSKNSWRITEFIEDGEDETSDFQGYVFSFETNGNVLVTGNGTNLTGTYKVFKDDGKVELGMTFPAGDPFDELTDDWYYISRSENNIRFSDDGDVLELTGTK